MKNLCFESLLQVVHTCSGLDKVCVEQDDVQIKSTTKLADAEWPMMLNGLTDCGRASSQLPPVTATHGRQQKQSYLGGD